ncbi:lysoplasmalogenase [Thalassobius vesicularis]|uniref:Lysoplasmalogenase n=1 Tax=Thalassobius vesicularis TaxID=1294297 RepID=A0A4S3MB07_9RHOB|nr:lysoplasmalogenase [Thalassobius vesicularis]THD75654.1 lysoplasmalogenase [Thalassobius vesicularis]
MEPNWALIAAGAVLALLYGGVFCWRGESWLRSGVKTGAVVLPALGLMGAGLPGLALAGLWACAAGDFLLSRPGEGALKAGIGAFAAGHILYVVAFLTAFPMGSPDALFWGVAVVLVALGASTEVWLSPQTGALRPAVRGYVVLILSMGICAALPGGPRIWVLSGALCFVASDLILSTQIFIRPGGRGPAVAVWVLYWGAQALLMAGFWTFAQA